MYSTSVTCSLMYFALSRMFTTISIHCWRISFACVLMPTILQQQKFNIKCVPPNMNFTIFGCCCRRRRRRHLRACVYACRCHTQRMRTENFVLIEPKAPLPTLFYDTVFNPRINHNVILISGFLSQTKWFVWMLFCCWDLFCVFGTVLWNHLIMCFRYVLYYLCVQWANTNCIWSFHNMYVENTSWLLAISGAIVQRNKKSKWETKQRLSDVLLLFCKYSDRILYFFMDH